MVCFNGLISFYPIDFYPTVRKFHEHQECNCLTHFQLGNYIRIYLKWIPSNPFCTLNVVLNLKLDFPVKLSGTFCAKTLSTCPDVNAN